MTPVEKLEAAIAELVAMRDETHPLSMSGNGRAFREHAMFVYTIDPQITILRDFLEDIRPHNWREGDGEATPVLKLANAILGVEA